MPTPPGCMASLTDNPSNPAAMRRRPQGVPNRIVNLWTSYDLQVGSQETLTFSGGFTNRSSMFADLLNTNSIPSYTTADVVANIKAHGWIEHLACIISRMHATSPQRKESVDS